MRFINLRQFLYLQIVNLQADVRNNLLAAVSMLANLINGTSVRGEGPLLSLFCVAVKCFNFDVWLPDRKLLSMSVIFPQETQSKT